MLRLLGCAVVSLALVACVPAQDRLKAARKANRAPVAADDFAATMGLPVNIIVLFNDSDVDGDKLTIVAVTQGKGGVVVVNPDRTITYTPGQQFQGSDTFTYTISDGQGGTATAKVTIGSGVRP